MLESEEYSWSKKSGESWKNDWLINSDGLTRKKTWDSHRGFKRGASKSGCDNLTQRKPKETRSWNWTAKFEGQWGLWSKIYRIVQEKWSAF